MLYVCFRTLCPLIPPSYVEFSLRIPSDSTSARTLTVPVNIPGGVTPESCAAACQSLGGYLNAGTETGHECWCDNAVNAPTQRVSDADCRMVCDANRTEYCGNINRLAIYHFLPADTQGGGVQLCSSVEVGNFTLKAVFKNTGASVGLKIIVVEMVKTLVWTLLSVSSNVLSLRVMS